VSSARTAFACFVAALGGSAIIGGVLTTEPAWIAEAQKTDLQRQLDLGAIANAIVFFEGRHKGLPYDLSKLAESQPNGAAPLALSDPESARPYNYARLDSRRYKLCAEFKFETLPAPGAPDQPANRRPVPPWTHSAGTQCFVFDGQSATPLSNPPPAEAKS
jgi:hypothetical protein